MGLDMYLNKEMRAVGTWGESKNFDMFSYWKGENVIYWRKANAVHAWIVRECANGEDDGQEIAVSAEKLKELADICDKVIKAAKGMKMHLDPNIMNVPEGFKKNAAFSDKLNYLWLYKFDEKQDFSKMLPTQDGCFFGNTEYDGDYMSDLLFTRDEIRKMLERDEKEMEKEKEKLLKKGAKYFDIKMKYTYHASW